MRHASLLSAVVGVLLFAGTPQAQPARSAHWTASWIASPHGPYPTGNAVAQPELKFAFPVPADGARDQTLRMIVKPDRWGTQWRVRLSNAFGTKPITFDGVYLGVQLSAGNIMHGTNHAVTFDHLPSATIAPGASMFSDEVSLPVAAPSSMDGRKLAVSMHVSGQSGPMTWHAKALQTSYITPPGSGSHGADETDAAFPFTSTSWYFLDAVDVMAPAGTQVVCAFGDSITDGTASTMNGDDRWPDVFSRRMHAAYGDRVSIVNAGIGGNRVISPEMYTPETPFSGGPSALQRLDRDLFGASGLTGVVFLEGVNDISAGASAEAIVAGIRELVSRVRAKGPLQIVGATITSSYGTRGAGGSAEAAETRKAVNQFIRAGGLFDAVADFDAVTLDPATGSLKPEFQPNSSIGGPGDLLHPNRAGYQAMGTAVDVRTFKAR